MLEVMAAMGDTWLGSGLSSGGGRFQLLILKIWLTLSGSNQVTAWTGMIRVDGTTYTWMGSPGPQAVTQIAYQYTSTKSIFTMEVGGLVEMNITFLSPVTPNDLRRQSLVFSYLHVDVTSADGNAHDVQLYSDITAGKDLRNQSKLFHWLIVNPLQSGFRETGKTSLNGIMVNPTMLPTTGSIDRLSNSFLKSTIKVNGVIGIGRQTK